MCEGDPQAAMHQPPPTSPKRKRGQASLDAAEPTPVAKQHLSVREGGDIVLGMLDQEAFARVIASGEQQNQPTQQMTEEEEEEGPDVVDDAIYRPSGVGVGDGADSIWSLRLTCLQVLDIFVRSPLLGNTNCRALKSSKYCRRINILRFFRL